VLSGGAQGTARAMLAKSLLVVVFCGSGLFVTAIYIATGNHGANTRSLGVPLGVSAWGLVSAWGVLRRRGWGRQSFLSWGVLTSLALCVAGLGGKLHGPWIWAMAGVVALATLLVRTTPRVTP